MSRKKKGNLSNVRVMEFAEDELSQIENNEISAFDGREVDVLEQIERISQVQVKAFLNSMIIEIKCPNVVKSNENLPDEEYMTFDEESFGHIKSRFVKKEKIAKELLDQLKTISGSIDTINKDTSGNKQEKEEESNEAGDAN